jgi:serine protease Do
VTNDHFETPSDDSDKAETTAPAEDAAQTGPATYAPSPEPRTPWAPPGWAAQTPTHWLEPLAEQHPSRRKRRFRGSYLVTIFVVALVAGMLGSMVTYAALMATNHLTAPAANVVQPSPTLLVPGASGAPATSAPLPAGATFSVTAAAARVSPSVVTITVQAGASTDPSSQSETGIGSGIIYDSNGFILTNRHVVVDATQVSVALEDGRTMPGTVYGIDTLTDLAIVKIDATDLPAAPIGDSSELQPGQTAIVIGSPLGTFTDSVTSGVISALGRTLEVTDPVTNEQRNLHNLVQTDAAINPGNSGGPLIDAAGTVVGVSTAYAQGAQGIFFAIPINIAKPIMSEAVAGQQLTRPWIGIIYVPLDRSTADQNKLSVDYGAWLQPPTGSGDSPIVAGGPAEKAGLQAGDIITSIDGKRIDAGAGLDDILSQYSPGDTLTLEVLRGGSTISVQLTLGTRPAGLN